jgi:hypothetical protein
MLKCADANGKFCTPWKRKPQKSEREKKRKEVKEQKVSLYRKRLRCHPYMALAPGYLD